MKKIIFTIAEGSIVKYLEPALQLGEKYAISDYLKQSLELTNHTIIRGAGNDISEAAYDVWLRSVNAST
jgi:DNA polymerase II large subunit